MAVAMRRDLEAHTPPLCASPGSDGHLRWAGILFLSDYCYRFIVVVVVVVIIVVVIVIIIIITTISTIVSAP